MSEREALIEAHLAKIASPPPTPEAPNTEAEEETPPAETEVPVGVTEDEVEPTEGEAEVTPEAEAEATPEEPATDEDPNLAKRFAALTRQERKLQVERQKLDAQVHKIEQAEQAQKTWAQIAKDFDANPIKALNKYLKIPPERLVDLIIAETSEAMAKPAPPSREDERIARIERELAEERKARQALQVQEKQAADLAYVSKELAKDTGDRWELIKNADDGQQELVNASYLWMQNNPGKALPLAKIADALEQALLDREKSRLSRLSKSKKLGVQLPSSPVARATQATPAKATGGQRTLSNGVNNAPPRVKPAEPTTKVPRAEMIEQLTAKFSANR